MDFLEVDFLEVDFLEVDFLEVDFLEVDFLEVDFLEADFLEVDFLEAEFLEVDFLEVDFLEADFLEAKFLTADFPAADSQAAHLTSPTHWYWCGQNLLVAAPVLAEDVRLPDLDLPTHRRSATSSPTAYPALFPQSASTTQFSRPRVRAPHRRVLDASLVPVQEKRRRR